MRRQKNDEKINLWRFKLPAWVYNAYYILLSFAFGQLCTILLTTVLKGSVGRLRPFFLIECAPNINCSLPENQHVYHVNYECTNKKFKQNTRFSFLSSIELIIRSIFPDCLFPRDTPVLPCIVLCFLPSTSKRE
jgi:hypothetical protein